MGVDHDLVLGVRDAIWNLPATDLIESHGIQHNLYIGLGVVPNKFGIEWNDAYGLKAARTVNPDVKYVSKEYYNILGRKYIEAIKSDPLEVARIYIHKLNNLIAAKLHGNFWGDFTITQSIIFFILPSIFAILIGVIQEKAHDTMKQDIYFLSITFFVCLYLAQGSVIHYDFQYYAPLQILFAFLAGYTFWRLFRILDMKLSSG